MSFSLCVMLLLFYKDSLCLARGSLRDERHIHQKVCSRPASILYLCNLRSKFDFEPDGVCYGVKLLLMFGIPGIFPEFEGSSKRLLIWIITMTACSATLFDYSRGQFVNLLSKCLQTAAITTFLDFLAIIDRPMWSSVAFDAELHALESQIEFSALY